MYQNPNEVIADYPMADTVKNNRVVSNICHNKYRLIVTFRYKLKRVYMRFIGTHKEYDDIKDISTIWRMTIKPIKTEQDYRTALKKIDQLVDCPDNSLEADELDVLSILVESYENEHYAISPPDPVDAIKFRMEQHS